MPKIRISILTFIIVFLITANPILPCAKEVMKREDWIRSCLDEECSLEDIFYIDGITELSTRNRGDLNPDGLYMRTDSDVRMIYRDLKELGSWKDVAWYYFVDFEKLEKFVLQRKLWADVITNEEYMAEINKEKIEAEKEKRRIFLYVGSNKAIVNDTEKIIDEENPETVVFVENDRSYLPVRFLCEEYGGTVDWHEETQTVNIHIKEHEISLTIGDTAIIVDGEIVENDVAPVLRNGRTFLPLRALVDAIGKYVIYNSGLIVIDDNQDMVWEMKNMKFVEGFSRERFGMFNAN